MAPEEAVVLRDGIQETIPVEEVVKGDRVIIHPGGIIPVDGKIVIGKAFINEAVVTGESIPAQKEVNDSVFSGTIVDNGYMEMIAQKVGDDTTFAKIIELVEEAQESKSKREKFLNKFASTYTPAVVVLSTEKVEMRLALFFAELIDSGNDGITVELPMSKKDLASFLDHTETLSRRLTDFEAEGFIKQKGQRKITILDLHGLLLCEVKYSANLSRENY
ncbi:helix-turn-helix domain-containing protein [Pseudogracilibacillus sp. SO30301A]|uniref:helix-turn-helix domain-containing protein n=1 Tax=Pseudogracilibacillus sp. SO30301A TaxID=3098291 RepID=UPI00300DFA52